MNQAVSTILIPLLLVSQSLFSVPHSHAGTSVNEPDGHAARPHVHLHHADHHDQHNDGHQQQDSAPEEPLPEHDSDAVYAGVIQLLNDVNVIKVAEAELSAMCIVCDDPSTTVMSRLCTRHHPPPILHPKCALFLQLLSIRC